MPWLDDPPLPQAFVGVEISGAFGPKPDREHRHDPNQGGVGIGLFAGFDIAAHGGLAPLGGVFVHGRLGRGWNGLTLGVDAGGGLAATNCHFGYEPAVTGAAEVGISFIRGLGPSLHVGARLQSVVLALRGSAHLGHDRVDDPTLAAGLFIPLIPDYLCIEGRPSRVGSRRLTGIAWGGDGDVNDVAGELGSIPAFLRLAAELRALDADPSLVARSLQAAREEAFHAMLCASAAARRSGVAVGAAATFVPPRRFPSRRIGLATLAVESWHDGVLGEADAADRAEATDLPHKARIARDERGHAKLASDIVRWAIREGGRAVDPG